MLNIALVDDDLSAIDLIRSYLDRYTGEHQVQFHVLFFSNTTVFWSKFSPRKYDIIFLDIAMPHGDGMTLAKKIRELDETVTIIFITNMAQYAIEGYSVQAYSFMLKPVSYIDFSTLMGRILPKVNQEKISDSIEIVSAGQVIRIPVTSITYVEIMGHKAVYHLVDKEFGSWESMKAVSRRLDRPDFSLCNACYLVNLNYVNAVQGFTVFLTDGTELAISQSKKKSFMLKLTAFLGR